MKRLMFLAAILLGAALHAAPGGGRKTIILTFDDGCKSHLAFAAPILRKYGFGATFFICRPMSAAHPEEFLTQDDIRKLHELGFEIGSHSYHHSDFRRLSEAQCREEMELSIRYITGSGVPAPVSFAYPGGPYAANAVGVLREFGIRYARTTESGAWDREKSDPLRLPIIGNFDRAMKTAAEHPDQAVILLYHGIPDTVHPRVNTKPEVFEKQMNLLHDNGFRVISIREFAEGKSAAKR